MGDEAIPEQPQPPAQPTASPPTPAPSEDWEARYKGSVKKIEELTLSKRQVEAQLAANASELEQLRTQLSTKDVEKDVAASEYQKQLQQALANVSEQEKELAKLRALNAKVEVAKELGATELFPVLDRIPYVEDREALKVIMTDFLDWGKKMVQQREEQLMAGYTPPVASPAPEANVPSSAEEWNKYINSLPIGPQRQEAWDAYFKWGQEKSK